MQIPQEALYKKNVLVVRGRFRPFTLLHNDMLLGAASQFFCDDNAAATGKAKGATRAGDEECVYRDDTLVLLEMTTRDVMEVLCKPWAHAMTPYTASWFYFREPCSLLLCVDSATIARSSKPPRHKWAPPRY